MGHDEVRLEELCAHITDGKHGDCEDQGDSGFYFLSCKDVADGKLLYDGARQITQADFLDTHRRTKLEPFDILITNSGTIGRMAVAPPNELTKRTTFQKSVAILKPIPAKVEPRFLYYLLRAESERLIAFAGGTAQKNLLLRDLRAFTVGVPSHSIQHRIVSILSAYDDLIENNARRIKILEDIAQMLYREWFVNFRFPGHEKVRMVESELGPIPEGWPIVSFDEISHVLSGGTPKTTEPTYWNGPIPFFGPTDAPDNFYVVSTSKSITELGLSKCNSKLYPAETVFITARGTVGKVALPASSMAMNQSCYALRGKPGINHLALFLITKDCARQLKQKSHGAVFDTITVETFQKLRLVRPPDGLLAAFGAIVRPMFGLVLTLLRSNQNLRTTRDFLLPKLISGEIPVEAAAELVEQPA